MRWSKTYCLLILIALALLSSAVRAQALQPNPEVAEISATSKQYGAETQHRTSPEARPSVTVVVKEPPAQETKQIIAVIQQQPYKHWWDSPNAPEWALFFLTIPYVLISVGLLRATLRQAKLTEDALIADKRAFVFASNLEPFWIHDPISGLYNWRLRPQWRNTGETATKNLTLHAECEIRNAPLPPVYFFNYQGEDVEKGFIGPKAELLGGAVPHVGAITPMDIVESQNGRRFIYLWGWVKYSDMFPNTPKHTTHFCWIITATEIQTRLFRILLGNHPPSAY